MVGGQKALKQRVWLALEDADNELSMLMRDLVAEQMAELDRLNERIQSLDKRVEQMSRAVMPCRHLLAIEGVGPVVATQLYSALGNGNTFKKGRQASAYADTTQQRWHREDQGHWPNGSSLAESRPDTRGTFGHQPCGRQTGCQKPLATRSGRPRWQEQGGSRVSEQDGANRLGCATPWSGLPPGV